MRVLIAEDDPVSRLSLQASLKKWGYEVTTAIDGNAAWEILQKNDCPRLAILDWEMPGLTGVEVCRRVRSAVGRDYVYIAFLTARVLKEDIIEGFDAGADDFITKPFNPRELEGRLRAADRILDLHAELGAIYNASPVAMILLDRDCRIKNLNPTGARLSGLSAGGSSGAAIGASLRCAHGGPHTLENTPACTCWPCMLQLFVAGTQRTEKITREEVILRPLNHSGSEELCFLVSTERLLVTGEDMVLVVLEDISARKKAERSLADLNRTLESRVEQRSAEVYQLLRQKDGFVRRLVHDLKTPLTPLVALLPTVEKRVQDPKAKKMLRLAIRNVEFMRGLVEKTLQLAELNNTNTKPITERIDLGEEIRNVIATLSYILEAAAARVINQITAPVWVLANPLELREVFHNLITNAIKYSEGGASLRIAATRNGRMVTMSFSDEGIGMTAEDTRRVFEEFYKADPSRHDRSSTGLGLSVCRTIVERQGGRIWAESPGLRLGSTISFSLPSGEPDIDRAGATPEETGPCPTTGTQNNPHNPFKPSND